MPENNEKEQRISAIDDVELRITDDEQPKIEGYAAKYGKFTDIGWFRERIKAGAFDEALQESDVRCLKNHDPNLILGRTKNQTLRLESNTVGLRFANDIPNTTTGKDAREEIKRGDISGCSFAFTVAEDDWKNYEDGRPSERTIVKIRELFDVGPVTYPAYPDTTVAARSLDKFKETNKTKENDKHEDEQKPELGIDRQRDIEKKYRKAQRIINRNKPAND